MPSSDMLLDDMINHMRNSRRGRGQGRARRGRGLGGSFKGGMTGAPHRGPHRGPLRVNAQPSSNAIAKSFRGAKSFPWRHDLFEDSLRAAGLTGVENGTKLFISNLDIGVTNEDIRELFSEIGKLKRYAVHYDKNGRSSGSAEVVFARRSDALRALKRYNSVQLDGKPMKVEIIGTHSEIPVSAHVNVVGGVNRRRRVVMMPGSHARGSAAVNHGYGQRNRGDLMNGRGRGRVNSQIAQQVISQLVTLATIDEDADILVYLNCPGGSTYSVLAIYDCMSWIKPKVGTVCFGVAASQGALLLAGGEKGMRYAMPNARIMIHQPQSGCGGHVEDVRRQVNEAIQSRHKIDKMYAAFTGQSLEKVQQYTERDRFLSVSEAMEFGLIDGVLETEY